MKRYVLSALCLVVALSMEAGDRKITIKPDVRHQTIEYFGAADAWSGNFVGKYWDENSKKKIADYLFSQESDASGNPTGIGLTMWRVNLGAGTLEQPDADIWPYNRRAESYKTVDGKGYDWGKCSGNEYFMQAAKERGCNNFILFSNSPLVQHTLNGKGYSSDQGHANIRTDCYDDYADYLVDVTEHLMDKGYNIPYISPINEPQVNWVTIKQEGSPWRNSEIFQMTKALDNSLCRSSKFDDVRILVGETAMLRVLYQQDAKVCERFGGDTLDTPHCQLQRFFDKTSPFYIGDLRHMDMEFTAHPYHDHRTSERLREVHKLAGEEAAKYGLDYHSSEWCLLPSNKSYGGITEDWIPGNHADIQSALMMARLIHSDFVDANSVSWCYWKGMELRGDHALVALHAKDGDIHKGGYVTPNKTLWVLGNYSSFVRPGYVRVDLDGADDLDTLAATAFLSADATRLVVVFVNSSFEDISAEVALPKAWKNRIASVTSYRTDARHDLAKTITGEHLFHTIAARGVTTVVIDFK